MTCLFVLTSIPDLSLVSRHLFPLRDVFWEDAKDSLCTRSMQARGCHHKIEGSEIRESNMCKPQAFSKEWSHAYQELTIMTQMRYMTLRYPGLYLYLVYLAA